MSERWIDLALHNLAAAPEGAGADLATADGRALIAEAVIRALPRALVEASVMSAANTVLVQRGIRDGYNMLSREIAKNAAATVVVMLEVGE